MPDSLIQYAQCWEDTDILLEALSVREGGQYFSVASGGENSFSIIASGGRVLAVDLSLPQLAVADLKRIAYTYLEYDAFLEFIGVIASDNRLWQYRRIRGHLSGESRSWLDSHGVVIENGIINSGRFERYIAQFRKKVLPFMQKDSTVQALMSGRASQEQRLEFYEKYWNNPGYRHMFYVLFSRPVMGRLDKDSDFYKYVDERVAGQIKERVTYGLIEMDGQENPYLHYLFTGKYGYALPHALREENFYAIKANIGGLTLMHLPLEEALSSVSPGSIDGFSLCDIFERVSPEKMNEIYELILHAAAPGARICYWNMLAQRHADMKLFGGKIESLGDMARELNKKNKAFFYSRFVIEEKLCSPSPPPRQDDN